MKRTYWTQAQIDKLIEFYPDADYAADLELIVGRPLKSLYSKAKELGLKRRVNKGNDNLAIVGIAHRFKKGAVPVNKGKKMTAELRAKVAHTFFKKGLVPHNTKPVGYRSIDVDGYHKIKTEKGIEFVHRKIWEDVNGPIPAGYFLTFKDGNRDNCEDVNNLQLVDRIQHLNNNSICRYPGEVRQTINLISKLNKIIKNGNTETN